MNGLNLTWKEAVLHVLRDHYPNEVSVQTIYHEVDKYRKLNDYYEYYFELTKWNEPRYQHIVGETLEYLKKKGLVENIRRGIYVLRIDRL